MCHTGVERGVVRGFSRTWGAWSTRRPARAPGGGRACAVRIVFLISTPREPYACAAPYPRAGRSLSQNEMEFILVAFFAAG